MTGTVLVVDDSPEVLAVVAARLKPEGYRTLVAQTWELGLDLALEVQPDAILLDVEMPEVSGLDLCRRLKADARTSAIPIIFLTAHDDVNLKVHSLDLGATDYVTKPFHAAELRARLRAAIRSKRLQDDLGLRARVDSLTGLLNRRELDRILGSEMMHATRPGGRELSLVLMDVDRFKHVNDSFGHAFGDLVLKSIGALVASAVRGGDFACRFGGEEIALVLPATSSAAAADVAARVRLAVRELPFSPAGAPFVVTSSFGVASTTDVIAQAGSADADALVRAADVALYAAKRSGRDRVAIYPQCNACAPDAHVAEARVA